MHQIKAKQFIGTIDERAHRNDSIFKLKNKLKAIFASNVQISTEASKDQQELCEKIRGILEAGVTEKNYSQFFHHLLWFEETAAALNMERYNMYKVKLLAIRQGRYSLFVPGVSEKRPPLVARGLIHVKPIKDDRIFEGVILRVAKNNKIVIYGLAPCFDKVYTETATFDISFVLSSWSYECMHRAIARASSEKQRVFPKPNTNIPRILPIARYFNALIESNPEQRRAVQSIVAGSSGRAPYLLHGPPGTGKTVTIVEAILQIVQKYPSRKVMVCTDSNMAADHVANTLVKYVDHFPDKPNWLLRANSKNRDWETLPHTLKPYSNGSSIDDYFSVKEKFYKYNIVVTTLMHAIEYASSGILWSFTSGSSRIEHLFIDEASQAKEPACLVPVIHLLAPGGQLVLAGDPYQLGPVCLSKEAGNRGLGLSLMERLQKTSSLYKDQHADNNYTTMLRNNFRSDEVILELPNKFFYDGQLRAQARPDPISKVDILGDREHSHAVVFHGVLSREQRMGRSTSFFNDMELDLVQQYIKRLIKTHAVKPDDIGVVTPYLEQVCKIKIWIKKQNFKGAIEVGTVESYQGREKRVVIISTVRANCGLDHNADVQLGFVADDKRFNVALTRAKAKVIVIGNPLSLETDDKWSAYMQKCRDLGTYLGFDPQSENVDQNRSDATHHTTAMLNTLSINDGAVKK